MGSTFRFSAFERAVVILLLATSAEPLSSQPTAPLLIHAQGSFFIGGEPKFISRPAVGAIAAQRGDITINQMYVQYQIPMNGDRHFPVVMVHGCCLSSKTWETTPDGRSGWSEYFLRKGRPVYLADQVSRARSGFDPSVFDEARAGLISAAQIPIIIEATHQLAWTVFRFGPEFGEVFEDLQFPIQAVDELYKQMIPDMNFLLPKEANPTWRQMAALGAKLNGAILIGHSQSGFFPEQAALVDSNGIKGIISIETQCETSLTNEQIAVLAKIPTLIMFGDHLGDVTVGSVAVWENAFESCNKFVHQLKMAGGDALMMHLPALGIKGNSHMLMQDKNSDQLADLVIEWIDRHVPKLKHGPYER